MTKDEIIYRLAWAQARAQGVPIDVVRVEYGIPEDVAL